MSRLCAKPTCSRDAERWFDVAAAQRQVIERHEPTPSTISLCAQHAERFSTPDGWTFESARSGRGEAHVAPARKPPVGESQSRFAAALTRDHAPKRSRARVHDRDAPWFLALSDNSVDAPTNGQLLPSEPEPETATEAAADADVVPPSAGSLLHRAFHGPDRESDVARAKSAERDTAPNSGPTVDGEVADLTRRREARSSPGNDYDIELPFPPFDTDKHVAVS